MINPCGWKPPPPGEAPPWDLGHLEGVGIAKDRLLKKRGIRVIVDGGAA